MAKTYSLKISSAVVIGGKIVRPGQTVEASEALAKNLLQRGKAELSEPVKAKSADGSRDKGRAKPESGAANDEE